MTCTIEIIRTREQFADLAPVWDALVARANVSHPFVTHTWMQTWWECFGNDGELMIALVRDMSGEAIAIAPLQRTTERIYGARHRSLRLLANEHSPRCDFIVAGDPAIAYAAIGDFLAVESRSWDVLRLCDVPAGSRTLVELTTRAADFGCLAGVRRGPNSPVLDTTTKWNQYLETLPSKRRWFLRNRLKRLSNLGRVSLETITKADDLVHVLDDGFRLEAAAWKGNAGTAIICDANVRRFYTTLAHRAADRGWLRLYFLKLDDRRIAFAYCLEYNNRVFLLKPGFDPEFASFSPGNVLFFLALEQLHGSDCVAYDFCGYDDQWKRQWAEETIAHNSIFMYAKRPLTRLDHYTEFALRPRLRRARNLLLGLQS